LSIDPAKATIALIEDDVLLGDVFVLVLKTRLGPAKVTWFKEGRSGLEFCRTDHPDLVIVDLGLPDMDGRAVVRALQKQSPKSRVLVLTGNISPTLPGELIALGVSGYVDKASPLENAEAAIRRVLAGGIHFTPPMGGSLTPGRSSTKADDADVPPEVLTERERQIVRLVARGLVSKEIAQQLQLSPRTIEKARAQIQSRLNVRDLPGLVRWCLRHGLE
jgi:DNA-binding NarL/FixJ family response regulator